MPATYVLATKAEPVIDAITGSVTELMMAV